jgi:hypothetical protein
MNQTSKQLRNSFLLTPINNKKLLTEEKEVAKAAATPAIVWGRPDEEHWMIIRDKVRYWTTDEDEQNGPVYNNIQDPVGDSTYGRQVGLLKDGVLELFVV